MCATRYTLYGIVHEKPRTQKINLLYYIMFVVKKLVYVQLFACWLQFTNKFSEYVLFSK